MITVSLLGLKLIHVSKRAPAIPQEEKKHSNFEDTVECRCKSVQYIMILHTAIQWLSQNINQITKSRASYGVFVVGILQKIRGFAEFPIDFTHILRGRFLTPVQPYSHTIAPLPVKWLLRICKKHITWIWGVAIQPQQYNAKRNRIYISWGVIYDRNVW